MRWRVLGPIAPCLLTPVFGLSQSFAIFFSKFVVWSRNAEIRAKFAHPLAKFASPARFLCHIFIHRSRLVCYRSVAKFQTPARPPIIRHPLPFRLLPSHDACFISPNPKYELRRAQSVWRPCALLLRRAHGLGICVCCVA